MTFTFPKTFALNMRPGAERWIVTRCADRRTSRNGFCRVDTRQLQIHTWTRDGFRGEHRQWQTFWHELLHAALHDMHHPLYANETFVDELAKRIAAATLTAEL